MKEPKRLSEVLYRRLRDQLDPRVKDTVARRVAQKVALAVLGNRLSAWEPVHKRGADIAAAAEALPVAVVHRLFEEVTGVFLVGQVVPIGEVRRAIAAATDWHLGMCVCRQARRVSDLYRPGTEEVYLTASEADCRPYLDRLLDVRTSLAGRDDVTSPAAAEIFDELAAARRAGEPSYTVGRFYERTWPYYEILLDHPDYAAEWRHTMARNRRTWRLHPELLTAWADLAWFTRGVVFTSMTMVDARYTICSCPGVENDGGCLLFNWHCYSGNPHVLRSNRAVDHGQRRAPTGDPLPCARFAGRREFPCFGCGCDHADPSADPPAELGDPRPGYRSDDEGSNTGP